MYSYIRSYHIMQDKLVRYIAKKLYDEFEVK